MKNPNFKGILLANYYSITYVLFFAFALISLFTGRESEFRDIALNIILLLMVSLLALKIVGELANGNGFLKNNSGRILRALLIFGLFVAFYFFS
jgi:hypothetical protein